MSCYRRDTTRRAVNPSVSYRGGHTWWKTRCFYYYKINVRDPPRGARRARTGRGGGGGNTRYARATKTVVFTGCRRRGDVRGSREGQRRRGCRGGGGSVAAVRGSGGGTERTVTRLAAACTVITVVCGGFDRRRRRSRRPADGPENFSALDPAAAKDAR